MRKLLFVSLIASVAFMSSCQKEEFSGQSLAAAAVADYSTSEVGKKATPIDIATLPAAVTDYITANYAGTTIQHAAVTDDGSYIVAVSAGTGKPTILIFDANGVFVEEGKPHGNGQGNGGNHPPKPTPIDVATLPTAVTDYVAANYAGATVEHAAVTDNGNFIVAVSTGTGKPTILVFDANGVFLQEGKPHFGGGNGQGNGGNHPPKPTPIDVTTLPAAVTDYVAANYAGATVSNAAVADNGNFIVAVSTGTGKPTILIFDANGVFLQEGKPHFGGANHPKPTPIDIATLPATVTDYVAANYAGSTIDKAGVTEAGEYVVVVVDSEGKKNSIVVWC
ncbi:MAG: PepSY-like domain-containing protein [Sphingobacteriales bacterium]|nr:PepSY-like domain-containing protein [Sphingobacteriales bacterium]